MWFSSYAFSGIPALQKKGILSVTFSLTMGTNGGHPFTNLFANYVDETDHNHQPNTKMSHSITIQNILPNRYYVVPFVIWT